MLLEVAGEVEGGGGADHVGNFAHVVVSALEQFHGLVHPVGADEFLRSLSRERLDLGVELRVADPDLPGHCVDGELVVAEMLLDDFVDLGEELDFLLAQ